MQDLAHFIDGKRVPGRSGRFADVFNEPAGRAPLLGTHTDEVLEEVLGLSPAEVGRLHDDGLVASAEETE